MNELQPRPENGSEFVRKDAPRTGAEWDARELNHRLVNSLQLAVDLLGFEQQRTADPRTRQVFDDAMARLAAVGQLHRYLTVRDPTAPVELGEFLRGLSSVIGLSTGLACELKAEPVCIRGDQAQQIGLLINECAINARKHAYGADGGVLRVESSVLPGRLTIVVSDEGRGLGAAQGRHGLGMTIIDAIVRQLGGTFTAESRGGARFTFLVPIAGGLPPEARSFANW